MRICGLNDLRLRVAVSDGEAVFMVDSNGNETGEALRVSDSEDFDDRQYICTRCGKTTDGSESFSMREHLGKINSMIDPFTVEQYSI